MLTNVGVTTAQGAQLTLPIEGVENGFLITDITGLDPVKASIVSASYATQDGEQYQSARRDKRNIIMTLALEPDYATTSVSQLRNQLYSYFMPKSLVQLAFTMDDMGDMPQVTIMGRVESFTSPQFTKTPTAVISFLCLDPDFVAPTNNTVAGTTVNDQTQLNIDYEGTQEAGILFQLFPNRSDLGSFSIYNTQPDGTIVEMDFTLGTALVSGDTLSVGTVPGSKGVTLTHLGSNSSLLYSLSPYSGWIKLFPGINKFRVLAAGAAIPYTVSYFSRYGGL